MKTLTNPIPYLTNFVWKNITGISANPERFYQPTSLSDIQEIVRIAERQKLAIRAVGSGHSFTDIAMSNDVLVDPSLHLNKFIEIDTNVLTETGKELILIQVEGGIRIQDLNKKLDKKKLALINMGAIDEQTLSGAISTNTHGTGIDLPAMTGMVKSMILVAAKGKAYRVEPTNGITDSTKYQHDTIELIQDDAIFYSAVLGLGCMGIVYAYILEVQPRYWLCETRVVDTWRNVKRQLLDESNPLYDEFELRVNFKTYKKKPRGIFILVNPFELPLNGRMENACMVLKIMEVDPAPSFFVSSFTMTRNWLTTIFSKLSLTYYFALRRANNSPEKLPSMIQTTVKSMKDRHFCNKSFRVLHQGTEYLMSKGYGSEFAYNYQERGFIDAVEAIFKKMKSLEGQPDLYPSSPLGLRFVKGSDFYIAPEYGNDACFIANPVFIEQNRAKEIVNYYQDIHLANGGKPHWGKMTNKIEGRLDLFRQWYPNLETWMKVMRRFNPDGTFDNGFSRRMGLTTFSNKSSKKVMEV